MAPEAPNTTKALPTAVPESAPSRKSRISSKTSEKTTSSSPIPPTMRKGSMPPSLGATSAHHVGSSPRPPHAGRGMDRMRRWIGAFSQPSPARPPRPAGVPPARDRSAERAEAGRRAHRLQPPRLHRQHRPDARRAPLGVVHGEVRLLHRARAEGAPAAGLLQRRGRRAGRARCRLGGAGGARRGTAGAGGGGGVLDLPRGHPLARRPAVPRAHGGGVARPHGGGSRRAGGARRNRPHAA